ncbi:unnamed protein product [Hermetia illucens]|uniref:ASD2 domain-containing protein n=1 Tax=Hermetia illucens TaxID=343691 RepID=A0A7R8UBK4_HERIL|nr:unnamed protein product [Hermetia illucens]
MVFGGRFRLRRRNSKASYLPRQTTDKLINATDPDHGSYKLTLTSNEDSINHSSSSYHEDILSSKCNNLPDVLPVGVKMQPSPPSSSSSSPRYGSNNNINMVTPPHTAPALISGGYPMKSMFHFQPPSSQASHHQHHNNRLATSPIATSPPSYSMAALNRSTSSPMNSSDSISPKYMSQSTIDLKKTHIFESTEEHAKVLSPAQSESNITAQDKPRSPYSSKREYRKAEVARKLSLEDQNKDEGRIVRAELVNTVLSSSPPTTKSEEKAIRKDSLRGNIEKITQLQSKLMSAHLVENGADRTLLGYTSKTVEIKSKIIEKEPIKTPEPKSPPPQTKTVSSPVPETPESERISQMDTEIDGLKLMQRTEIILRLNAPTMEAASQTDETLETELSRIKLGDAPKQDSDETKTEDLKTPPPIELRPRQKHPEEIDCDNLSKDLVSHLSPSDKLHQILAPKIFKSTADYVNGLYNPKIMMRPVKRDVGTSTPGSNEGDTTPADDKSDKSVGCELKKSTSLENSIKLETLKDMTTRSSSPTGGVETKAKIVTRFSQEVTLVNGGDCGDLMKKKEELINRLTKKLLVLSKEQTTIAEESSTNDQLGSELATKVAEKLRPIDATKFRAYIDDVGHITMLLLSLSGRLARVENTLHNNIENSAEKKILEVKRDRLAEQLEEAKRLKEDIDRRGTIVSKILEKNLAADENADYDYFINMKAKLIVDSREIADKIKVSEEQLKALKDTLVQSEC